MITASSPLAHVRVTGNTLVITSDSDITYPEDDLLDIVEDKKIIDVLSRKRATVLTKIEDNMIPRFSQGYIVEDTPIFYESDEVEALVKSCDWSDFMKVKRVKI